ncbi:hypothetical protein ACFPM1_02255 [Halorubrum rubrum]|uniref:Uncharacterized protein n=1 Tax=Halorubrum rubrum TaxID=1126240 RepID=A0ABD5QY06_9EURY|nr:hypothetical protein [Halorubrum rubrum]
MRGISRRSTLLGIGTAAGAVGVAGVAGCLGRSAPRSGDDAADGHAGSDPDLETAVHQTGGALSGPAWRRTERPGFCTLFAERVAVEWLLRDAPPETIAFVDETDFEESALAYVESVGRNTCERLVEFADVAVDDGTLTAAAEVTAVDDADGDVACGQAITYAGAFLRVTADTLPESIRVEVTDGWGTSTELTGEDGVRDPAALDGSVRPDGDPPNVPPALSCPDDAFERHPAAYDGEVNWGSGGGVDGESGLELRVVDPENDGDDADDSGGSTDGGDPNEVLRFERGDAFRVEMTNVSARPVGVGNHAKYNLEVETEAGWTDVRGSDDGGFEYTDELVLTRPGETVEWSFSMDEEGIVAEHPNDDLRVCPDLGTGRYRFVFFGADDLAVAFDHVE